MAFGPIFYGGDDMKLTPKQKAFADYYLISLNCTDAAKRAGYSEKTAHVIGQENLKKPAIRLYIDEIMNKRAEARYMDRDRVLELLSLEAEGLTEEEVIVTYPGKGTYEVAKKKISARERIKALELLGKRHALFTDRVEASTTNEIIVTWGDDDVTED
jgi:phage terminase small subunit